MARTKKKQEALSVSRLINEVLVAQLSIPFRQIPLLQNTLAPKDPIFLFRSLNMMAKMTISLFRILLHMQRPRTIAMLMTRIGKMQSSKEKLRLPS